MMHPDIDNSYKIVSPLVTQLAWSHHLLILSKAKSPDKSQLKQKLHELFENVGQKDTSEKDVKKGGK